MGTHNIENEVLLQRKLRDYLDYFREDPKKQEKVLSYIHIPSIFSEEFFLISMVNMNDEDLERRMVTHFENNEINKPHDFFKFCNEESGTKRRIRTK